MKKGWMHTAVTVGAVLWAGAVVPFPNGANLQKGKKIK